MMGDAKACRRLEVVSPIVRSFPLRVTHENKLPRAPPSNTISYLESIGFAKEAL